MTLQVEVEDPEMCCSVLKKTHNDFCVIQFINHKNKKYFLPAVTHGLLCTPTVVARPQMKEFDIDEPAKWKTRELPLIHTADPLGDFEISNDIKKQDEDPAKDF